MSQHESTRVKANQQEITKVQNKSARIKTNLTRVNTSRTRLKTNNTSLKQSLNLKHHVIISCNSSYATDSHFIKSSIRKPLTES